MGKILDSMAKAATKLGSQLEEARKVSKIKRINDRLRQFRIDVNNFGPNSKFYIEFKNAIELLIPRQALTPAGTISTNKNTLDLIPDEALNTLEARETAGEVRKKGREEAKKEEELTGYRVDPEQYFKAIDYVFSMQGTDEWYDALVIYWESQGGKGSGAPQIPYTEWERIIRELNAEREYGESYIAEARDIRLKAFRERWESRAREEIFD